MKRILTLVDDVYEDLELWYPKLRLEEEGWRVVVAGPEAGRAYAGKHGYPCVAEVEIGAMRAADFDALLLPGGFAPDRLRRDPHVLDLTRAFDADRKPLAFICHAGWICISAGILKGRRATSTVGIKDDMSNAGALWADEALVVDGHLISSRTPQDLPVFAKALVERLHGR
jgi:protease I